MLECIALLRRGRLQNQKVAVLDTSIDTSPLDPNPCCAEYQFCSRRGLCDFTTGRCACVDGFSRANCDVSESLITEDFDADVLQLYTTLADFTGKS